MLRNGFNLLEMLIVLLLVAVLAAFAVPAYQAHVRRVNRAEATVALYALLAAQERFHLGHGRYAAEVGAAPPAGLGLDPLTEHERYRLVLSTATDGQSFIATAVPTDESGQRGDAQCLELSLDHRGRRGISGSGDVASCWR